MKERQRKTIFDIERRCDLHEEYDRVITDLRTTPITSSAMKQKYLYPLLDVSIRSWPHRQGATSIDYFASSHGFMLQKESPDEHFIFQLELLVNLLHWAPKYELMNRGPLELTWMDNSTVSDECNRCLENIEYFLERINMRVRSIEESVFPQYIISKRDANVDAVIEDTPELADILLAYLDIRNQDDEASKKAILKAIADYLEQKRNDKYYKGTAYNSLCEDLFTVFNNASIRHHNSTQWEMNNPDRIKLYDQTFRAAVHLLQMESINEFHEKIKELKTN